MKYFFFLIIFFNIFCSNYIYSFESYVVLKVNNKIITNVDIDNEYRYLIALNTDLQNIDKKKIMNIAKDSIIREKIKEDELSKYYDLSLKNKYIDRILDNFYKKLGMKNEKEFKIYLSKYNLSFNEIKKKIEIEAAWNDLVYQKYASKLKIDEIKIKNKINELISKNKKHDVYLISEILFNTESYEEIQKKYKLIEKSISESGFKNTANLYSVSDSAKLGGQVGWIDETKLSEIIKKEISKLKIGEYTKPITIPSGFLIIHLDDKKTQNIYLNFDEEFEKQITYEKNIQLEQYSAIYYKKINKNSIISEK
jgi:peptidyl-prolyl cis-trans isomerase SurA